jgi:dTDP-glucose 4,6-dehydratase
VLIFSTDEVFGPAPEGVFYKEDDRFKPSNPYAAAKAGEEMIAFSFAHAFRIPISIVRSMNIIAEKQHPEKFLPKTIRATLNNEPITLHSTDGKFSSRCWIHARNVADGMLFLTDKAETEQFYHIVGEERTVFDIANIVFKTLTGRDMTEKDYTALDAHSQRPGHDFRYALSGKKLQDMGWEPPKKLEESLIKAIKWYLLPENKKWLNI